MMGNWDSYRDDLDALKIELEKLFEVRNDVMRKVRIAEEEEQQMMKPTTDEVLQLWLSKVQAVETEVDDLIRQISQEIEELHPGGFCSRNLSSYEFEDTVADKLQAVMNLIIEGAFVVTDDEARVVTIPKDEEFVAENLPEDVPSDEGTIVGMESIFTQVWRCLEEGGYVGIIGLYGMGGVGKTTLLKQIYQNMLVNYWQKKFGVVIWVSVSKELRLEKIQEKIGMKIGLFDKVWKNKNFEEKASDILKILKEKKFVLFMDELWERVDLTKVGVPFPNPENSSKIVFTTRSLEICRLMEADRQFKMNCLSDEEAWELFKMSVGEETLHSHPEQVVDIARDISKECSGLPLALVSIGRALAGIKTPQQWRDVLGVLTRRSWSTSSISGSDDQLKKYIYYNLKLSYDHLQNDMFKSCLLYSCLFPRNDKISKGHLIDCWIGEGFLDDRLGAQSQGYHIIDVLLSACLLEEEAEDDNYVKMHNWIHDMSLWIATEIEEEKRNFFVSTDAGLTEPPEIEKWVNMTRISMTKNVFTILENAPMCSHLQTLFLNRNPIMRFGGDFFRFMPCLKVLNLSNNTFLLELPSEISNLVSLQHLDLSCTAIISLPNQLGALKKLKCLNLEYTFKLYAIPPRLISTLSVLHVLRLRECGFLNRLGKDSVECNDAQLLIEELFCLKSLSMLSISLRNSHALQKLLSSYRLQSCIQSLWLQLLHHPKSIVISITYMNHLKTLRISECEYLEELEVDFGGETQAQAISNFYFLDEVIIESCPNLQDLTWLILAPNLKRLEISQCSELEEIIKVGKLSECPKMMRNLTPFSKLKILRLSNLPNLRSIYWSVLPFPDLKKITITKCPKLQISLPLHHFNKDHQDCEQHSKEKITINVPSEPSGFNKKQVNLCLDWFPAGSYFAESDKVNKMAAPYESSLFSSSLSELFRRKLRLSSNIAPYGHSVDTVASHFEEEAPFESLEELEAQTIGNLLPSDDDLFSGVIDGIDSAAQLSSGDDMDGLDFFSSVRGMDLEDDGSAANKRSEISGGLSNGELGICNGALVGEHPYGEHPSRTLFVRNINSTVENSELKALFEQYGDIRTFYTAYKHRGFVMISYYDIRGARSAMKALQNKPMRRMKLDIHFSIPKDNPTEKDVNQGTLVVFNLDSSVSNEELHEIFCIYGEIKEIREMPHRSHHKFIEFYDVRAAEAAVRALNKIDIADKRIKLLPSRPGGSRRFDRLEPWSHEEDEALQELVCKHGPRNWSLISRSIPGRSGKWCQLRWCNYLLPQAENHQHSTLKRKLRKGDHGNLRDEQQPLKRSAVPLSSFSSSSGLNFFFERNKGPGGRHGDRPAKE